MSVPRRYSQREAGGCSQGWEEKGSRGAGRRCSCIPALRESGVCSGGGRGEGRTTRPGRSHAGSLRARCPLAPTAVTRATSTLRRAPRSRRTCRAPRLRAERRAGFAELSRGQLKAAAMKNPKHMSYSRFPKPTPRGLPRVQCRAPCDGGGKRKHQQSLEMDGAFRTSSLFSLKHGVLSNLQHMLPRIWC